MFKSFTIDNVHWKVPFFTFRFDRNCLVKKKLLNYIQVIFDIIGVTRLFTCVMYACITCVKRWRIRCKRDTMTVQFTTGSHDQNIKLFRLKDRRSRMRKCESIFMLFWHRVGCERETLFKIGTLPVIANSRRLNHHYAGIEKC